MTLFDLDTLEPCAPCQHHSPTSCAAAEAIVPHLNKLQARVLDYLRGCGERGATDEELVEALRLSPSTARPRRIELVKAGLVRDSGRTRKTNSGREATVWVATNQQGEQP
jgi:predicted ArsR family transcriptional regulator